MTSPILGTLTSEVRNTVGVMASATTLIRGFRARLEAAKAEAIENGATAEELEPLTAEIDALKGGELDLATAVTENA